jgi:hypothetical protein
MLKSLISRQVGLASLRSLKGGKPLKNAGYSIEYKEDIFKKLSLIGLNASSGYSNVVPVFVDYGKSSKDIYGCDTPTPLCAIMHIFNKMHRTDEKYNCISELIFNAGLDEHSILFCCSGLSRLDCLSKQKIKNELAIISRSKYHTIIITDTTQETLDGLKHIEIDL